VRQKEKGKKEGEMDGWMDGQGGNKLDRAQRGRGGWGACPLYKKKAEKKERKKSGVETRKGPHEISNFLNARFRLRYIDRSIDRSID